MCKIVKIDVLSPEEYITITDGTYEVVAFSSENKFSVGEKINDELIAFNATNIVRSSLSKCSVQILNMSTYLQHIVGILVDKSKGIINIGKIKIHVSAYIPNDICNGQFIEFDVARLDL